jgi:hypothetical protein
MTASTVILASHLGQRSGSIPKVRFSLTILDEVRHMTIVDCDDRSPATEGVEQSELLHTRSTADVHHRGRLPDQSIRFRRSWIVVMA